jgi:flagellar basal-body rod modification protein FlgD
MSSSVSTANGAGVATASSATAAASKATFGNNFDTFLKLLTSQLQNQNPLSPMDTTQFTQQLVQFSSVEQAIRQNSNLETLISMQRNSQSANAVNYIGKTVSMTGDIVGLVNGEGRITYNLPETAGRVTINIYDNSGKLLARTEGDTGQGAHAVKWNGRSDTGAQLPDGDYKVEIAAQSTTGGSIPVDKRVSGEVTSVDYTGGTVMLTVNGTKLPISQLSSVYGTAASSN